LIAARQDFERDEDLLKPGLEVRLKQVVGEIAALELEQVMQSEGEQLGAEAVDLVLEGGGKHAGDIAAGEGEHGSGQAAAFESLVGKAEAGCDELGAEDLVAAGTPFALIFIRAQDGKIRAVAVIEDLDRKGRGELVHPGQQDVQGGDIVIMPGKLKVLVDKGLGLLEQFLQVAVAGKVTGKMDYVAGQRIGGRDVDKVGGAVLAGGGYGALALDDITRGVYPLDTIPH